MMNELLAYLEARNVSTRLWVAAGEQRFATTLTESSEHWAVRNVFTPEDLDVYLMRNDLWDLYKEVTGVRPRHINIDAMDGAEVKEMYDGLLDELEDHVANQKSAEAEAVVEFEEQVQEMIELGACTRDNALLWLWIVMIVVKVLTN